MNQPHHFPRRARHPALLLSGLSLALALAACGPSGGTPGYPNHLAGNANPAAAGTAYQPVPAVAPQPGTTPSAMAGPAVQNAPVQSAPGPQAAYPQAAYPPAPYPPAPYPPTTAPQAPNAPVMQPVQSAQATQRAPAPAAVYGQISSIEPITHTPQTSGAGAVVGGVLGAVVGNQIGSGNGRAAATVLGGVGGAVLGNKVEKSRSSTVVGYRVHVQLDNGGTRSFERKDIGGLEVGSRVRVDGGRLRSA